MFAPILFKKFATSTTCGSFATFSRIVSPFRHRCGHHDIDGSADRNHIQIDMTCHKIDRVGHNSTADDLYIRSQCTESLGVLVDRTAPDRTSAGSGTSSYIFPRSAPIK